MRIKQVNKNWGIEKVPQYKLLKYFNLREKIKMNVISKKIVSLVVGFLMVGLVSAVDLNLKVSGPVAGTFAPDYLSNEGSWIENAFKSGWTITEVSQITPEPPEPTEPELVIDPDTGEEVPAIVEESDPNEGLLPIKSTVEFKNFAEWSKASNEREVLSVKFNLNDKIPGDLAWSNKLGNITMSKTAYGNFLVTIENGQTSKAIIPLDREEPLKNVDPDSPKKKEVAVDNKEKALLPFSGVKRVILQAGDVMSDIQDGYRLDISLNSI